MPKVTDLTADLAAPIAQAQGCSLWDVEYLKEAGEWFLRVYIDKPGGVSINDCEAVSRPLSDALDQADPIQSSYTLEVSSAGADRCLRKPEHFRQFLGSQVDVKLYRAREGRKELTGALADFNQDGSIVLECPGGTITLEKKDVAQVRLHVTF